MDQVLASVISSVIVSILTSAVVLFFALGTYKQKVDRGEKDIDKCGDKIDDLKDRVSRLEGGVDRDRAHSDLIQANSPLSLTDKGKSLLLDCGGKDYIDENLSELVQLIQENNPKTAYDVQELCRQVLQEKSKDDSFNSIKGYAFQEGVKLDPIIDVMAIYLRDHALEACGMDVSELD